MLDLGDTWPGRIEVRDSGGALANAGAVAVTITLPDGSTAAPAVTNASTGVYTVAYVPALVGQYVARWVATGANACALVDSFTVTDAVPVVGLVEARGFLRKLATTGDDRLRDILRAATERVEELAGRALSRRTVVEEHTGGKACLLLRVGPVQSVTGVTEDGAAVAASSYELDGSAGVLWRTSGLPWSRRPGGVTVTYVAGPAGAVRAADREAVLVMAQHIIATSRGGERPRNGEDAGGIDPDYAVERTVMRLVGHRSAGFC